MKEKNLFWMVAVLMVLTTLMLNYQSNMSFAQGEAGRYLMSSPNSGAYILDTQTGSVYYVGFNVALAKVGAVPK